ncbi:MAG: gamma carbonic anhydrase family protein [Bacteroidota bacterium]
MPVIKTVRSFTPQLGENNFIADNATIVGQVRSGRDCSFWFNCVLRGDVGAITLGDRVNIQDGAVVHCTYQRSDTILGNNVSVGHNAIIHGCTIHDNVLVGMGAIVMDKAVVESKVIIAAGAVVTEGAHLESGYIYAGVPARKLKPLKSEMFEKEVQRIANNYLMYSSWFKEE